MKTRLLVLTIIALFTVGCSAFFNFDKGESGLYDEEAPPPADSTTSLEKNEESRDRSEFDYSPSESSDELMIEEPVMLDADGYADSDEIAMGLGSAESDVIGGVVSASPALNQQAITLKAGEIDDNAEWDDYLLYRRESLENFGQ